MDIEFITEEQPVETLCFHFILNQTSKSKMLLLNSILMHLATQPRTLQELFHICARIVDDNSTNSRTFAHKEYYKNMAILLRQVITKYPSILLNATPPHLAQILAFSCKEAFCAVTGNDFISLVVVLLHAIHQPTPQYAGVYNTLETLLLDPKMHIGSYRQSTRNNLLEVLYKLVQSKNKQELSGQYMGKIIRLVEDEKDPRNISTVFQIYRHLLEYGAREQLSSVKKQMFDGLEMYYPIDFEGDADKHNIKLHDITSLLDQCLTNAIFAEESRALLMVKMGAAPIGKYISTFISTRHHANTSHSISFWLNLLLRTAEEEYLEQEYSEHCEFTLSSLVTELLNRLVQGSMAIPSPIYSCLVQWMSKLIGHILCSEQNSKHASLVMVMVKDMMSRCRGEMKYMVGSYVVCRFVQCWKEAGDIVYKLGLLVPVLQSQLQFLDREQVGLLIITLTQIFHTADQPQPKLIVLKLFMILSKSALFFKMIAKTNILHTCLQQINAQHDSKITKAFLDFIIELYASDERVQNAIIGCQRMEIKVYGLLTLASKIPQTYAAINQMMRDKEHHEQLLKEILGNLRMFKPEPSLQIICNMKFELTEKESQQVTAIIDSKSAVLELLRKQEILGFIQKYGQGAMMLYLCRNVWRPYLTDGDVRLGVKNQIEQWLRQEGQRQYCIKVAAFYNKSVEALGSLPERVPDESINNQQAYLQQVHSMLPIKQGHAYRKEECMQWPTLVHYCWSSCQPMRTDLIQCLPTSILGVEAHRILPVVVSDRDVYTLSKILPSIPQATIVAQVLPFVVDFLELCNPSTDVEKIVSCNRILLALDSRAKEEEEIHRSLMKNKGRILVALEERLLQHRKRRARQSSRTIFSLYNSLK